MITNPSAVIRPRVAFFLLAVLLLADSAGARLFAQEPMSSKNHDDPARISVISKKPKKKSVRVQSAPRQPDFRERAIRWYFGAFAFIIGACVGSFLNVVIYRLPLGMGLLRADSHCPVCKMPIAKRDNIPIFGWLKLRGRCRECAVRISPRYMLVELATALIYLMLAVTELLSGGANLPGHVPLGPHDSPLAQLNGELIGLFITHCFFLSALLCCVFILVDKHALPPRLLWPTFAVGLLSPFRVTATIPSFYGSWAPGIMAAFIGLVIGGILGAILGLSERYHPQGGRRQWSLALILAIIGCYLGWEGALLAATVTALVILGAALLPETMAAHSIVPAAVAASLTAMLQIPLWSRLSASQWWPTQQHGLVVIGCAAVLFLGIAGLTRLLRVRRQSSKIPLSA